MNFKTSAECGVKTKVDFDLFHCNGICSQYGFLTNPSHVTHYLKFSVKINTNQLNGHFSQGVPYLENEVSEFVLEGLLN